MTVHVLQHRTAPSTCARTFDVTSRSSDWTAGFSPFYRGPVPLYHGAPCFAAENVENAWQFSKVYADKWDTALKIPTPAYFAWAQRGFSDPVAHRYPAGKGAVPVCSWWGRALGYIEARKRIYVPAYRNAVVHGEKYCHLLGIYQAEGEIALLDFDAYDREAAGMTLDDVLNCPDRKMGHGFVLAMMLERGDTFDSPDWTAEIV